MLKYDELPKDDNGKELRKLVSQLLKEVKPKSEYPILVFDPIGEQQRKTQTAMDNARDEGKKKEMEEKDKRQADLRKKNEEERKKQKKATETRLQYVLCGLQKAMRRMFQG